MNSLPILCPPCGMATQHDAGGDLVRCRECGHTRPNDVPLLIAQVQDMRFCPWCRETLPADHDCPAGSVGCTEREPGETPCGACGACIAAMTADLARRAEYEHGSPSDIDTPGDRHV